MRDLVIGRKSDSSWLQKSGSTLVVRNRSVCFVLHHESLGLERKGI